MFVSIRGGAAVLACTVVVIIGSAQAALADTSLGHSGTVGAHSLNDTASSPGATRKYKNHPSNDAGDLVRIVVNPPNERAVAGKSAQTVGWQFTVQRRVQGIGGATPWTKRYTSPEMTAVTDDAHNAAFTSASVPVKTGPFLAGGDYEYRVIVKTIWHRANGSVQGTARNRIDFYKSVLNTGGSTVQNKDCFDWLHASRFTGGAST